MKGFRDKELYEAAKLLIENVTSNVESLKSLSADSLAEAYFKATVGGDREDDFEKSVLGMALGLEQLEVPEEYAE